MGLPILPGPGQAIPGPRGGVIPPAPGLMPYKPSVPAELMNGVSQFMQSFIASKQASQEMYKGKLFEALQHKQQGIPTYSDEQIMKFAKKAGMDWNTEPPTPQETEYKTALMQQNVMQQNTQQGIASQGAGGTSAPIPSSIPGLPQTMQSIPNPQNQQVIAAGPGPSYTQQNPPGLLSRILQKLGITTPPVSTASPAGQFLQQLGEAGQIGGGQTVGGTARTNEMASLMHGLDTQFNIPGQAMNMQQQMALAQTAIKAFNGDPQAMSMMAQSSKGWATPINEFADLMHSQSPGISWSDARQRASQMAMYTMMGGPNYTLALMNMAKEQAQYFPNQQTGGPDWMAALRWNMDPAHNPGPQMSVDQMEKVGNFIKPLQEAYGGSFPYFFNMAVNNMSPDRDQLNAPYWKLLQANDSRGNPLFPRIEDRKAAIDAGNLGARWQDVNNTFAYHQWQTDVDKLRVIQEALGPENKQMLEQVLSGKGDPAMLNNLAGMLQQNKNLAASIPIKLSDGTITHMGNAMDIINRYRTTAVGNMLGRGVVMAPRPNADPSISGQVQHSRMTSDAEAIMELQDRLRSSSPEERKAFLNDPKIKAQLGSDGMILLKNAMHNLEIEQQHRLGGGPAAQPAQSDMPGMTQTSPGVWTVTPNGATFNQDEQQ